MLRCKDLTVRTPGGTEILSRANAVFRPRALNAVIGPSGCGKTTLVKAMMGIIPATGKSFLGEQRIESADDLAGKVGFAPQFTTAHPQLTVEETFRAALDLTVKNSAEKKRRLESVLQTTGLAEHRAKRVGALSGGQLRRLGLGTELTLDPPCMVCDEVTSGLDPNSETQILELLRRLAREREKTFVCIIHNLAKLDFFDWITVVHQGCVVFQGTLSQMLEYFGIPDALRLYDRLNAHEIAYWSERWAQCVTGNPEHFNWKTNSPEPAVSQKPASLPWFGSQLATLLRRRFLLFFRDTGYLALTAAITFGFPIIVVIFALHGLPQVPEVPLVRESTSMDVFRQALNIRLERAHVGALASGLIMFQVILLTLMGANNGGREIAGERMLYEKERLTGLRPGAYVISKIIFATILAAFQGVWMAGFVKTVCAFPGPWDLQLGAMAAVCISMSIVCLGFSAVMQSAEKASLLSIYLVGFQIPLSGVVLALPDALVWVCRPFINAYWGWSGFMKSMQFERIYDAFMEGNDKISVMDSQTCVIVLLIQALVGMTLIVAGCYRRRPV